MKYKEMVIEAYSNGLSSEKIMWQSVGDIDMILENMKAEHPDEYWAFIRKTHQNLFGNHYNEEFARCDVAQMEYTDRDGEHHQGEYWSKSAICEATKDKIFPPKTTDWDKYVGYNAMHADLCKSFGDSEILEAAYLFWFADEDWKEDGKVWQYFAKG